MGSSSQKEADKCIITTLKAFQVACLRQLPSLIKQLLWIHHTTIHPAALALRKVGPINTTVCGRHLCKHFILLFQLWIYTGRHPRPLSAQHPNSPLTAWGTNMKYPPRFNFASTEDGEKGCASYTAPVRQFNFARDVRKVKAKSKAIFKNQPSPDLGVGWYRYLFRDHRDSTWKRRKMVKLGWPAHSLTGHALDCMAGWWEDRHSTSIDFGFGGMLQFSSSFLLKLSSIYTQNFFNSYLTSLG